MMPINHKKTFYALIIIGCLFLNLSVLFAEEASGDSAPAASAPQASAPQASAPMPDIPISNEFAQKQQMFNHNDVDVAHGVVRFSETDIQFPKSCGINFSISRVYNSRNYKATATANINGLGILGKLPWGKWAGHGWGFNFAMSAYIVWNDKGDKPVRKVIIDSVDGVEEYQLNQQISSTLYKFTSKTPGNFKIVYWVKDSSSPYIYLITEDGTKYYFQNYFHFAEYGNPVFAYYKGFYLSKITDSTEKNNIIINFYDGRVGMVSIWIPPINVSTNLGAWIASNISHLIGKEFYDNITYKYDLPITTNTCINLPKSIMVQTPNGNNIEYKINFTNGQITEIKYPDVNGSTQRISYSYDTNGNLISVQKSNLPPTNYTYQFYTPHYFFCKNGKESQRYYIYASIYHDTGLGPWTNLNDDSNYVQFSTHKLDGYLLSGIETSLKSKIEYSYEYALSRILLNPEKAWANQVWIANPNGSYPVVIEKKIKESSSSSPLLTYSFIYLKENVDLEGEMYIHLTDYLPVNATCTANYFKTVTVKLTPNLINDETNYFSNGLLVKQNIGKYQTTYDWDYTNNRLLKITKSKSNTNMHYNDIIEEINQYEYGSYNNVSKITTYKGNSTTPYLTQEYSYISDFVNNFNKLHVISREKTTINTGQARMYYYFYDSYGRLADEYEMPSYGNGNHQYKITYDDFSRPISKTVYNTNNQPITTAYEYSIIGNTYTVKETLDNKTSTQVFSLYTNDLLSYTNCNGNITSYSYDEYSRPLLITYPNNSQDTYSYSGDLKKMTSTKSGIQSTAYLDNLGRMIAIDNPSGKEDISYTYYFSDNIAKVFKDGTEKKAITYDKDLRITQIKTIMGTISFSYDDNANTIQITDPSGKKTATQQDEFGRTTQKTLADNSTISTEYDGFNQQTKITDPNNFTYRTVYDDFGRIMQSFDHCGTSRKMEYYPNGLLKTANSYDQNTQLFRKYDYTFDAENRPIGKSVNNSQVEWITYDVSSASNGKDRVTSVENDSVKTEYQYDNMGRVTQEKKTLKTLNKTYTISNEYGTDDTVKAIKFNDGKAINYEYDGIKRLQKMKYCDQSILEINAYNANGTLQKITLGNGITIQYDYIKDKLLSKLTVKKNDAILYQQSYTYDAGNNITSTTHTDYLKQQTDLSRKYTYNQRNYITTTSVNDTLTYSYNYDKNGNHLRYETPDNKNIGQDNITLIPATNRIEYKTFKDGRKIKLAYDPEGNVIKKESFQGTNKIKTTTYVYNYQNQITQVKVGTASMVLYQYDHQKQRVYKYLPQTQKGYIYYWDQAGRIMGEGLLNGPEHHVRYFYLGNEKIAMARNENGVEKLYYFVNNAQGTPVMILDSQGKTVSKINLDEWGNLGKIIGAKAEINFTGKKLDTETGLYYFNQRYYDPELGRFLTEDPAEQGLNPYGYCGNNPLVYIDADGEWAFLIPILGALAQGALYGAVSGAVMNGVIAAIYGQNILNAMGTGALSGAQYGVLGGGIGYGLGAMSSLGSAWASAANGLNVAMKGTMIANIAGGVIQGCMSGDWRNIAAASVHALGYYLDTKGKNPLSNFARGIGQKVSSLIDSRLAYRYHHLSMQEVRDNKGELHGYRFIKWHGNDEATFKQVLKISSRDFKILNERNIFGYDWKTPLKGEYIEYLWVRNKDCPDVEDFILDKGIENDFRRNL